MVISMPGNLKEMKMMRAANRDLTDGFSWKDIESFARQIGIDVGIVVGRLQYEGLIPRNWHNGLRRKYGVGKNNREKA